MPWTKPANPKGKIDRSGEIISGRAEPNAEITMDDALDIAGNWRSSHGYPLHVAWTALRRRALAVDHKAIVPKRQKRLPSIISKLRRFRNMQLSQMQDLGGARAVVKSARKVDKLAEAFLSNSSEALQFVKKFDYVHHDPGPKTDGYRSIHLVYRYQGDSQEGAFKGMRVEIQIRSRMQHAWATALEIIDTFRGQRLKQDVGDENWKRFFALVGSAMALKENRPLVPGTPKFRSELISELRELSAKLNINDVFLGLMVGVNIAPGIKAQSESPIETYILTLNSSERTTGTRAYASNKEAEAALLEMEKENIDKPHIQTVMVSAQSLRGLQEAYPNYYVDTRRFLAFLRKFLKAKTIKSSSASASGF
jgi:hypothetical protein